PESFPLSLHDALPILGLSGGGSTKRPTLVMLNAKFAAVAAGGGKTCAIKSTGVLLCWGSFMAGPDLRVTDPTPKPVGDSSQHYVDRKSTRLNSSHVAI